MLSDREQILSNEMDEQAVFLAARKISDQEERHVFVRRACAVDRELFRRVMDLLRVDLEEPDFLNQPLAKSELTELYLRPGPQQGDVVGHYSLIDVLGAGGMGIVWLAEQSTPIRRRVALKVMNTGFGTESDLQQFDAERQLLAQMDHPGIVKLLDAGNTDDGRPWFSMEFVTGLRITDYCRQRQLSLRDRLRLFQDVCESVEHAHQRGVVHRDLKPGNILIAEIQGRAISRLIDFGVAFSVESACEDCHCDSGPTRRLQMVRGTPAYMSPEQAHTETDRLDHRTDVYSLGALLYELITGVAPYAGPAWENADPAERLKIIRETTATPLAERLRNSGLSAEYIGQNEKGYIRRTLQFFQHTGMLNDLSQIVMQACARNPEDRYQSVRAFAEDLHRCLAFRPLLLPCESGANTQRDSVRKFVFRNMRGMALITSLVLCAVVVGTFAVILFAGRSGDAGYPDENTRTAEKMAVHQAVVDEASAARDLKSYIDLVREAHFLSQQGRIKETEETLVMLRQISRNSESGTSTPRRFEDFYLSALCESPSRSHRLHSGKVFDVRFMPDGSQFASGSGDTQSELVVFDLQTGERRSLDFEKNDVNACWYRSSDGVWLTAHESREILGWDLSQPEARETFRLDGFVHPIGRLWLSDNEEILVVMEVDWPNLWCRTTVWNPELKLQFTALDAHRLIGIHESELITASATGTIEFRTLSDFRFLRSIEAQLHHVTCGDVSAGGMIALGNKTGSLWLWRRSGQGQQLRAAGTPVTQVRDVVFTPDSSLVVSAHNDGVLRIWASQTGEVLKTIQTGAPEAWSLDVSPDGQFVVVGLSDGTVRIYDLKEVEIGFHRRLVAPHSLHGAGFSTDGTHVVLPGAGPNQAKVVRLHDSRIVRTVTALVDDADEVIRYQLFGSDHEEIVLASSTGKVYVAGPAQSEALLRFDSEVGRDIFRPTLSADGRWISVAWPCVDNDVEAFGSTIRDLSSGTVLLHLPNVSDGNDFTPVMVKAFSVGKGERIVGSQGRTAAVWKLTSEDPVTLDQPENSVTLPRWINLWELNRQGLVLICTEDQAIYLWDSEKRSSPPRLLSHRESITSVSVTADGGTLATGSDQGDVLIWNLPSGEPLFSLPGASGPIHRLQFTEDGQHLYAIADSSEKTGEVLHWGLSP